MQAIALKVRSEGKEYKRQPLKAARGNVAAAKVPQAAVASKYVIDAEAGSRPEQPVQVRRQTCVLHLTVSGIPWLLQTLVRAMALDGSCLSSPHVFCLNRPAAGRRWRYAAAC